MNYGMYFSEELQKMGARAIPTIDVVNELLRRGQYKALYKGVSPLSRMVADPLANKKRRVISSFSKGKVISPYPKAGPSNGFIADLRPGTMSSARQGELENVFEWAHNQSMARNPPNIESVLKNIINSEKWV